MLIASAIIYRAAGMPAIADAEPCAGLCWLCATEIDRGVPVERWQGANFTGQNKVRAPMASHVCEPCIFVCAGRPPDALRMYSHLWSESGGWRKLNKGDKPEMRAFLCAPHDEPWFAAIADSGQKQLLPWTPVNPDGGSPVVNFEERIVAIPPDASARIERIAHLLTLGATKAEVERGDYGPRAWQLCGDALRDFEQWAGRLRHGAWFMLAVWLAQRDEEVVQRRMTAEKEEKQNARRIQKGTVARPHGRGATGPACAVPSDAAGERAQTLGSAADTHAGKRSRQRKPGGVVDSHDAPAPARQPEQLGFENLLRARDDGA